MIKHSRIPAELLNECSQRLLEGESLAGCVKRYPQHAAELEPLLQTIAALRSLRPVPARDPVVAAHSRSEFVAAALRMGSAPRRAGLWERLVAAWRQFLDGFAGLRPLPAGLAVALAAILLVGVVTTGTVAAAAGALPGDRLYQVKILTEQVRLGLTLEQSAHRGLLDQFAERRRDEARKVLQLGRHVAHMTITGEIESLSDSEWRVAGFLVRITPQTTIEGQPGVGAFVRLDASAPGDGTLVALHVAVERAAASSLPEDTAASAQLVVLPPNTPTPTSTPVPHPPPAGPTISGLAGEESLPQSAPKVLIGATPTRSPTPTPTPRLTLTPSPTPQRTAVSIKIEGHVKAINGAAWTVGESVILTDGNTVYEGSPGVGDEVQVKAIIMPDGSLLATLIRSLTVETPEPMSCFGQVISMGASHWVLDKCTVAVGPDTVIDGDIAVGDFASVAGEKRNGQDYALRITKVSVDEREFPGVIESMDGSLWLISGRTVEVNGATHITGDPPAVGKKVDVRALQLPGRLVATLIYVYPPPTATPKPPTDTPEPPTVPPVTPPVKPTRTPSPMPTKDLSFVPGDGPGGWL
jgi:hypothetical protein